MNEDNPIADNEDDNNSSETSSFAEECWINWFCSLHGNHFFCEVDKSYIEDSFNLFGLKQFITKDFNKVLDTILDRLEPEEAESEDLSRSAALLYGLIHARFIITAAGLEAMHQKCQQREFGECPRTYCKGQAVLPIGITDEPKQGILKLFCPKCQDIYNCNPNQRHIDGAYFGTTFPHLYFMTYDSEVPTASSVTSKFIPRVFGFKIHPSSDSVPKPPDTSSSSSTLSTSNHQNPPPNPIQTANTIVIADILRKFSDALDNGQSAAETLSTQDIDTLNAAVRNKNSGDYRQILEYWKQMEETGHSQSLSSANLNQLAKGASLNVEHPASAPGGVDATQGGGGGGGGGGESRDDRERGVPSQVVDNSSPANQSSTPSVIRAFSFDQTLYGKGLVQNLGGISSQQHLNMLACSQSEGLNINSSSISSSSRKPLSDGGGSLNDSSRDNSSSAIAMIQQQQQQQQWSGNNLSGSSKVSSNGSVKPAGTNPLESIQEAGRDEEDEGDDSTKKKRKFT